MTTGRLPLYLVLAAVIAALTQASAAPLDSDTCAKLQSEQTQLENAGIEKEMAKGPAWGKANLAPQKLAQVRRFIELEEQLLFRCRNKALVHLPPEPEVPATIDQSDQDKNKNWKDLTAPDAAAPAATAPAKMPEQPASREEPKQKTKADKTDKTDKADKKAAAPPAAKPAPAPKKPGAAPAKKQEPAPKKQEPAAQPKKPAAKAAARQAPEPAAKAKPKADDAYKAPPPDPSVNPFANQPVLPVQQQ